MKIRVLSDLHLEFINSDWTPPPVEADVVVLAGDIHLGEQALPWINQHFAGKTVIYILGNHEGYKHDLHYVKDNLNTLCGGANAADIRFLDNDWTEVDGVWFFGGTLWTDFKLYANPEQAMYIAESCMNDYRLIRNRGERLRPWMTRDWHEQAIEQIQHGLKTFEGKKVVVTHHGPSERSISPGYRAHEANPAYASNLDWITRQVHAPALWIHGHMHRSSDYFMGNTRVIANPKGYPVGDGANPDFNPQLVVEV